MRIVPQTVLWFYLIIQAPLRFIRKAVAQLALAGLLAALPACADRREDGGKFNPIQNQPPRRILTVGVDVSGSYITKFKTDDGKASGACFDVIERNVEHMEPNDLIVIGQISKTENCLIWSGTPDELGRQVPTPEKLRELILAKSNPDGSRVYAGIADLLEYVLSKRQGKCQLITLCLTDMIDTEDVSGKDGKRLVQALRDYHAAGGWIGFYWVGRKQVPVWRKNLAAIGFADSVVAEEFEGGAPLPSFGN